MNFLFDSLHTEHPQMYKASHSTALVTHLKMALNKNRSMAGMVDEEIDKLNRRAV